MAKETAYREWKMEDTNETQKVLFKTWVASYSDFIPMTDIQWYFNNYYSDINFARLCADPDIWSFVAESDGNLVGYARGRNNLEQKRFYLESLYVLPEFQGKGIGTELLKLVEKTAQQLNHSVIWLGVMMQNIPSIEWYKKLGFQFVEETPFQMGKTSVNHLVGFRDIK